MLFCLRYSPLLSSNTFCVFLCFLLCLHVHLLSSPILCSSPSNPFFVTTFCLAPLLALSLAGSLTFPSWLKNEDKLSLIMCSLRPMSISEQSCMRKEQGEMAYLHDSQATRVVSAMVHSVCTAILNDFLVITPVLLLVCRGFLKMIFVEERSQLHPFKCLFLQSKHAPSHHRPSSSLCQV